MWGEGIDECVKANLPDVADIDGDSNTSEKVDLYYHHNSLGSVVAVTDVNGVVKESYRYTAFGKPTIFDKNGAEAATSQVEQPFLFTGARFDFEEGSGLYQMRLRYYDPAAGRFVSRDPLGLWGDVGQNGNGQGYCEHNPVNRVDPWGLADKEIGELERKLALDPGNEELRDKLRQRRKAAGLPYEPDPRVLDELGETAQGLDDMSGALDHARTKDTPDYPEGFIDDLAKNVDELEEGLDDLARKHPVEARDVMGRLPEGSKAARRLKKVLGPLGILIGLAMFAQNANAKGLGAATLDEATDAVPGVCWVKLGFELSTGKDVFPPGLDYTGWLPPEPPLDEGWEFWPGDPGEFPPGTTARLVPLWRRRTPPPPSQGIVPLGPQEWPEPGSSTPGGNSGPFDLGR